MKNTFLKTTYVTLMACSFAMPAAAASWEVGDVKLSLGGSVRLDAGYKITDPGDTELIDPDAVPGDAAYGLTMPDDSRKELFVENPGNSRVKFKAKWEDLTGYVEAGLDTDKNIYTRKAYVSYKPADTTYLIGRTYTPIGTESPSQRLAEDKALQGFGDLDLSRSDLIMVTHNMGDITFDFAIQEITNKTPSESIDDILTKYRDEAMLPAIIARMTYESDNFRIAPAVYWQQVSYLSDAYDTSGALPMEYSDLDIMSYLVAVDGSIKFDPVTLGFSGWYGQNPYIVDSGIDNRGGDYKLGRPVVTKPLGGLDTMADVEDATAYGAWLSIEAKLGDNTLCTGLGYQGGEIETGESNPSVLVNYKEDVSAMAAFVNVKIPVKGKFSITPEIAYFDKGDAVNKNRAGLGRNDLGSDIYAGIHFQYDF